MGRPVKYSFEIGDEGPQPFSRNRAFDPEIFYYVVKILIGDIENHFSVHPDGGQVSREHEGFVFACLYH